MYLIKILEKLKKEGKLKSPLLSVIGLTHLMSSHEEPVKNELTRQIQSFIDNFKSYKLTNEMMNVLAINQIEEDQFLDWMSHLNMSLDNINSLITKCLKDEFIDVASVYALVDLTEEIEQDVANIYKLFSEECSLIEQNYYGFDCVYVNIREVLDDFIYEILETLDFLDAMADFKPMIEAQTLNAYISMVKRYIENYTLLDEELRNQELQEMFSAFKLVALIDEN